MKKQVLLVQFTLRVNCLAQCRTRSPQCGLNVTANASVQNSLQTEPQSVQDKTVESSTKAEVIGRFIHKTKTHCFTKIYDANLKGGMESNCYTKRLAMYTAVFLKLLSNYTFLKL